MQVVADDDRYDIEIEADSDFVRDMQHKTGGSPTDLTGYTGTALVKTWARGATLLELDVEITDASNGRFRLSAPAADCLAMERSGVFSVKFTKDGAKERVVWGRAHYSPGAG